MNVIVFITERYLFDVVRRFDGLALLYPLFQRLRVVLRVHLPESPLRRRQVLIRLILRQVI